MQWTFGPQYCETPLGAAPVSFPIEFFNTYSNLVIVLFGLAGFLVTSRRAPRAVDLYILCFLLVSTGIGSLLWHGLRTRWALSWDVWSGVLFLMGLFFLWARRVMPLWQAVVFFAAFFLITRYLDEINLIPYGRWVSMMPAILLFAVYLIYRTATYSKRGAVFGGLTIVLALAALSFRTLDRIAVEQAACDMLPIGTHFLWHMLLSSGAFFGLLAMITVARARAGQAPRVEPKPAVAPAE